MKHALRTILFVALVCPVWAQTASTITTWDVQAGVVPEITQMAGAALVGDYLFLLGGNRGTVGDSDKVTRYYIDPVTGAVSTGVEMTEVLPSVTFAYINGMTPVTTDTSRIYIVGGGWNAGGPNRDVVTYNTVGAGGTLQNATWLESAAMPTGYEPELGFAVICDNGYLYAGGGDTRTVSCSDICVYAKVNGDGTLGTFTQAANLPDPDSGIAGVGWWFAAAVTIDNYIIATPGITSTQTATNAQDDVYICKVNNDGTMGSWVSGPALPAVRYGVAMVAVGNTVFVLGGRDNNATPSLRPQKTVWRAEFDSATGTLGAWQTVDAELPNLAYYHDANYSATTRRIYVSSIRKSTTAGDVIPDIWASSELSPAPPPTPTPIPTPPPAAAKSQWNLFE